MAQKLSNTLKDTWGIIRAVTYRSFRERNWSKPQPMFNVLKVADGKELLFEAFLTKAQGISTKIDSPISLGPYKTDENGIYIYVTHYGSTGAI